MNLYILWSMDGRKFATYASCSDQALAKAEARGYGRCSWYVGQMADARGAFWLE